MNRRKFIANTGIGVSGMLLAHAALGRIPNQLLGSSLSLPAPTNQVRHGLFQLKSLTQLHLPAWLRLFEPQNLLANGCAPSNQDLTIYPVQIEGEAITLGYTEDELLITTQAGVTDSMLENCKAQSLNNKTIELVKTMGQTKDQLIDTDSVILCMSGMTSIPQSSTLTQGQSCRIQHATTVSIHERSVIAIITT